MNKRESILLAVTGAMVVLLAAIFFLSGGDSLGALRRNRDKLATDVGNMQIRAEQGQKALARFDQWKQRSLPSNLEKARQLYQNWLWKLAGDPQVKLRGASLETGAGESLRDVYRGLRFTLRGQATMEQLTCFLYKFYSVGYLHKLRHLSIQPVEGSDALDLVITIESLSLLDATSRDELPKASMYRLAQKDLKEYQSTIVRRRMDKDRFVDSRGLFTAYVPPTPPSKPIDTRPPVPPKPPEFDPSRHTVLTGIIEVEGQPAEAWLRIRPTDQNLKLHQGDPIEVGSFRGKIVKICPQSIEVAIDGEPPRTIKKGESLVKTAEPDAESAPAGTSTSGKPPEGKPGEAKPFGPRPPEAKPGEGNPPGPGASKPRPGEEDGRGSKDPPSRGPDRRRGDRFRGGPPKE